MLCGQLELTSKGGCETLWNYKNGTERRVKEALHARGWRCRGRYGVCHDASFCVCTPA